MRVLPVSPLLLLAALCLAAFPAAATAAEAPPAYATHAAPLFQEYCAGCHNEEDWEGELSLETFAALSKGGESGAALVPGNGAESLLWQVLAGAAKPKMPPKEEPQPPAEAVALLKAWIDAGAPPPAPGEDTGPALAVPALPPAAAPPAVTALALHPDGQTLAVARFGAVDLVDPGTMRPARSLTGLPGKVNAVHFSRDGARLITASGITGLNGSATLWDSATGERLLEIGQRRHRDVLYDAELSPDGSVVATAGYDRKILLWNAETGELVRTIEGHNGAVYDLAFSPDGSILASASADQTVKLWRVSDGERLDTLNQPLEEQFTAAFSPSGDEIYAAGADNRIRQYQLLSRADPATNPVLRSRFAHEGSVVALALSPDGRWLVSAGDDRTLTLWQLPDLVAARSYPPQPDVPTALAIHPSAPLLFVARMNGTVDTLALVPELAPAGPAPAVSAAPAPAEGEAPAAAAPADQSEAEPNNDPASAQPLPGPSRVAGSVATPGDADLYRFTAGAGTEWVVEVEAARGGSPLDSKVEILDASGEPVLRTLLEAVRDSWFTFRGKDSDTSDDFRLQNWEEMELNEYLYANGEVVRLWHYPRGPDSGFQVYPGFGQRFTYFGTTAATHALGAPCYIVRPHPPGTRLTPNGLPVFPVYFENDDDPRRRFGSDSHLLFTAPASGDYLVRVSDVRGFGGEGFSYHLTVRPRRPDFQVRVEGGNLTVPPGGGREFTLRAERLDGFDGEIRVAVEGLPPGFQATSPVVIQADQETAIGLVNALPNAEPPAPEAVAASRLTARALIAGREVPKEIGALGEIHLGEQPKLLVRILPADDDPGAARAGEPFLLEVAPGETVTARVRVERFGYDGQVPFGNADSGRNLPHGVFVDNIGLNGLLILEGETERTFFITASPRAQPATRPFHLRSTVEGNEASWPVLLRVTER